MSLPGTASHLAPLIAATHKLSWANFVDTHDRWAEEVYALCALAGPGVEAALESSNGPLVVVNGYHPSHATGSKAGSNALRISKLWRRKAFKQSKADGHASTAAFTTHDDALARAIIVLTMTRDIRDKFARFMKAAKTAKQLINGIAILKEAVKEGQAYEEREGQEAAEAERNIRSKAQALAEEVDWAPATPRRRFLFFGLRE